MKKQSTSIRLDSDLLAAAHKRAGELGIKSLSAFVDILFRISLQEKHSYATHYGDQGPVYKVTSQDQDPDVEAFEKYLKSPLKKKDSGNV